MKNIYKCLLLLILCVLFIVTTHAQSAQQYNNSLRLQYGLYQYNKNQSGFLNSDSKGFQSLGVTYRHQLNRVSGLNFTGRYYEWDLSSGDKLKTTAAQAMWVLHAKRVGRSWHVNRFTPYAGIGLGFETHNLRYGTDADSSFSNLYIPLEAGIIFNLSSRWSLGVFAEYKIAAASDLKKLAKTPEGKLDIVNTAGVSLAYHFGQKKKVINAPIIYTNPLLTPIKPQKVVTTQPQTDVEIVEENDKVKSLQNDVETVEILRGGKEVEKNIIVLDKNGNEVIEKVITIENEDVTQKEVVIKEKNMPNTVKKTVTVEILRGSKDTVTTTTVTEDGNTKTVEKTIEIKERDATDNVTIIKKTATPNKTAKIEKTTILRGANDSTKVTVVVNDSLRTVEEIVEIVEIDTTQKRVIKMPFRIDTTKKVVIVQKPKVAVDSTKKVIVVAKDSMKVMRDTIIQIFVKDTTNKVGVQSKIDTAKKVIIVQKPKVVVDSTKKVIVVAKDSMKTVRDTVKIQAKDTTINKTGLIKKVVKDSILTPSVSKSEKRKVDSLNAVIQGLNANIEALNVSSKAKTVQRDTVVIKPLVAELNDEPIIKQLKESHNKVSELAENNYKRGSLNEAELQKIKVETDAIKKSINYISKKDNVSSEELGNLYKTIASLQDEVAKKDKVIVKENKDAEKDIKDLQYKLDKTKLELEYAKRYAENAEKSSNDGTVAQLLKNQEKLQDQLRDVEKQNSRLKGQVETLNDPKVTVQQTPVAAPKDTVLEQLLKNQALLQEKLAAMESQNNQLKGNMAKLEQKDSVKIVPVQKVVEPAPKDAALEQLLKNQAFLQEKLDKLESQNNQLKEKITQPVPQTVVVQSPPPTVVTDNIFYTVRFGNNSTTVQSKDIENLKYELSKINPQDGKIFMLSGFADKSGNAAYNMKLSKLRVKAVKSEFLKYGINDVNLVERFFGSDKASADVNENDRKVVIRILN